MTVTCPRCYKKVETREPNLTAGLALAQGIAAGPENLTFSELMELRKEMAGN